MKDINKLYIATDTALTFISLNKGDDCITEYERFIDETEEDFVDSVCEELKNFGSLLSDRSLDWRKMIYEERKKLLKFQYGNK